MAKWYPNREHWRARKWAQGLCGNCGKQPLAMNKRTGEVTLKCRGCHAKGAR